MDGLQQPAKNFDIDCAVFQPLKELVFKNNCQPATNRPNVFCGVDSHLARNSFLTIIQAFSSSCTTVDTNVKLKLLKLLFLKSHKYRTCTNLLEYLQNVIIVHNTGKKVAFPVAGNVQEIYRTGDISSTYPGDGNVQEICKFPVHFLLHDRAQFPADFLHRTYEISYRFLL